MIIYCTNTTLQWRTNIQHIKAEWGDVGDFSDVKIQPHFDPIDSLCTGKCIVPLYINV